MTANNFIVQARIDDEKFTEIAQRYRTMKIEMNLQYSKLRRKTFSSIHSLPKVTNYKVPPSPPPIRSQTKRPYTSSKKIFYEENIAPKKNQDIFVVTTVHVKARAPDSFDPNLTPTKKNTNFAPIKVSSVRSVKRKRERPQK